MEERVNTNINSIGVCPYCHGFGRSLDPARGVDVEDGGGFWLRHKKKVAILIGHLKKEFKHDKTKLSVRKLVKSAGIVLKSQDLSEFGESPLWRNLIANEDGASFFKSILLEKGLSANGSIEAFELRREVKIMPLIHKRKVWWESVPGANSYVLYLSEDGECFEPDNFSWETTPGIISKEIIGKTEVILPEDWPEFPREPGTYYIGITSKDELGNQSNPFIVSGSFKFLAPPAPSQGGIQSL